MTKSYNRRLIEITVILFLFFVQFSNVSKINPIIAGKHISVYLGYIVVFVSFVLLLYKIIKNNGRITIDELVLITGIVFTVLLSVISGRSFGGIWNEMYAFLVPILLYYPVKYSGIKQKTVLNCLLVTSLVGGIVSLLIAMRVIEVDKWAAVDDFVRSAGYVDGTLGAITFCCALVMLINKRKKYSQILALLGLIGSAMIVLFGLSRLRIAILICAFFVILFIRKSDGHSIQGKTKIIVILSVLILAVICLFPDIINIALRMLNTRFSNLGTDGNTSYRIDEMHVHIKQLISTCGIGVGWGVRDQMVDVFVHNFYTGVLMHCGIIFGLYYIYFLIRTLTRSYICIKKQKNNYSENMLVFMTILVIILSGFGGAGITQPGAWFGMALIYSREDN